MADLQAATETELERYRPQLTGYCYRMLGSAFEAEDAVQETMLRAWRNLDQFEGRSAMKSWLYSIATNVCLTMLDGRKRRARPMDIGGPGSAVAPDLGQLPEATWLEPMPDGRVLAEEQDDPVEAAISRETLRLAFVAALQHLPPRQRAVLILREVLRWKASEVAELLDASVASVNSALQRARTTIAASGASADGPAAPIDQADRALLARYVDAFEHFDIDALVALLHEDAMLTMPPYELWLQGAEELRAWYLGYGRHCEGSRLVAVTANGQPAFAQYRSSDEGGHAAWALQVMEFSGGKITAIHSFLDTPRIFPLFGLPLRLEAAA
jgi:RNA polymerase sigma-70 factor (ECF subfamily)